MRPVLKLTKTTVKQIITFKKSGRIKFIDPESIIFLEADDNYTCIHLTDDSVHIISKPLTYYSELLGSHFIRCHRSYLVNRNHIEEIDTSNGYTLHLGNGRTVPIARRRISYFKKLLANFCI